jgi:putative colanic acid biosynthesis UDP-glucose lipid carrier transferase
MVSAASRSCLRSAAAGSPMGLLARHQLKVRVIQRAADPLIAAAGVPLLAQAFGVDFEPPYLVMTVIAALLVIIVFGATHVYQPWRASPLGEEIHRTWMAWGLVVGILLALAYASKTGGVYSRRVILSWMTSTPVAITGFHLAVRLLLRSVRARGRNSRTYVIVGGGDLARRVHEQIGANPWLGMRAAGYFDDRLAARDEPPAAMERLGDIDALAEYVNAHRPDFVYIALPMTAEGLIREVIELLSDSTASVYLVPDIFTFQLLNARVEELNGVPVIALRETPFAGIEGWVKRAEDVVLASIILLLISPLLAVIAVGVKLSSAGPVIFKQRRYGLGGEPMRVYKFRSMSVCEDGPNVPQASRGDARVTRFGAFLRRTSLDELPQFFNVLQGRMSIVGPRPHAVAHNEHYRRLIRGYMLRHKVRPGITGLAQVNGCRGETDTLEKMEKRVEYDLRYIRTWSLHLDLKIIGQTILNGFSGRNAY